jgi:hypothetical protein
VALSVVEEQAAEESSGLIEPLVALWALGSVVLATGVDASGERAVAVWQISPDGHPDWVVRGGRSRAWVADQR